MNTKYIIKILGVITMLAGAAMLPSALVSLLYHETHMVFGFIKTILPLLIIGFFMQSVKPDSLSIKIRDAFMLVSMSWVIASLAGAAPFWISGYVHNIFDSIFESVSGFTTTGSSILPDIEMLPKGLLFWRSFTHWLGGMGIIIFVVALLPALGISSVGIAKAEMPGPTLDKVTPKMSDTARFLYIFYTGMTILMVILLLLGGLSPYDAAVHAFGTVATAGFSSYNSSVAVFDSVYVDGVVMVFMILSGVNYNLYYEIIRGHWHSLLRNSELKFYLGIITVFTLIVTLILYFSGNYSSILSAFRYSSFQVASLTTTTGYVTADFESWSAAVKVILFMLLFVGGCSSSTTCGIKAVRILIVCKLIAREFYLKLHPRAVISLKLNGHPVRSDVVSRILSFIFAYLCIFVVGCLLISLNGFDFITTISSVATTLSCVGPGFGAVGPICNFSDFSSFSKVIFSMLMLIGRLELFTFIILFSPFFWSQSR